ncbi:MAG: response regulator [Chloroflexi bacterium]|nr:response regulator [Chloroflexota bacterium]
MSDGQARIDEQQDGVVLVVDDEPDIVAFVQLALESEGYTVVTAAHGQEALRCITARPPAVILLDLNMPVMTGWELHERLRRTAPEIPVVFMTAGSAAYIEAQKHKAAGYLIKPFDLARLYETVERFARPGGVPEQ